MKRRSNRSPLWRLPADLEVREEMETHLELLVRDLVAEGLDEDEARRRAAERFGDARAYAEDCRRQARRRNRRWQGRQVLDELRQDLRTALRQWSRQPLVALTVIAMLAIGLGATTAGLDLVDRSLLRPPAFEAPERLVTLWEHQTVRDWSKNVVSPANFLAWREETDAFEDLAGFITVTFNLGGGDGAAPLRVKVRGVTEGYFGVLGVPPLLGRSFSPEDAVEGAADVVLLGHNLWQQRFGGRRDVIGQTVELDGQTHEIVGVMPAAVRLDMGPGTSPYGDAADLYSPLPISEAWRTPRGRWLQVVARLRDGVSLESSQAQLDAVMARQRERHPRFGAGWSAQAVPLLEHLREPLRLPVMALTGGALMVLLIACFNASSLLLGRLLGRAGELEVRAALGAGRARLLRQLLVEGAVLASAAGLLGFLLAEGAGRVARAALPAALPAAAAPGLGVGGSWPILLALTAGCALLFGLLPGLPAVRRLGVTRRSVGDSRGRQRLRGALVFAQVTLTLILLIGAGLMLRTVYRLLDIDPGFERQGVLTFALSPARGSEPARVDAFYDELLGRLEGLPEVREAGAVSHLPMASAGAATSFWASDRPRPEAGQEPTADIRVLRGGYFAALGIPLLEGRAFDGSERPGHEPGSIVVSESVAERCWPGESALGRELFVSWGDDSARRVVGVVADVRQAALGSPARDAIYFPASQQPETGMTVVLATRGEPKALVADVQGLVHELDPDLPLYRVQTVEGVLGRSIAHQRLLATSLLAFALLAVLLAAVGIYGLTTLAVTQSTREIGLRMALGATPRSVQAKFLARIGRLTAAALVTGFGASLLLAGSLEQLLFELDARDPLTLGVTAALLAVVALAAAFLPARRAARLDPTRALRWE